MATLAEAVDAGETDWIISAGITADFLIVESETVAVLTHFPVQLDPQTRLPLPPRIRVQRAAGGTTAASHADGTTLTPLIPPAASGESGGAIAVDNTVDPPFDASTFVAPGATESAPGEATLPLGSILTDPGALWEAEHSYATGDRILVWDTVVFESQGDGLSDVSEPDWDTVNDIADNEIMWNVLGEVGELNNALMPLGLGLFALTSPSLVVASVGVAVGVVDPSAGAGVAYPIGFLYRRTDAAELWMKTGAADTEWTQLAFVP